MWMRGEVQGAASVAGGSDTRAGLPQWYALAILVGIYTFHTVDRNIVSVLLEPIKKEFGVSDTVMGAASSMTHTLAFVAMTVPLGMLADRVTRTKLLGGLVSLWSGLTMICSFAQSALMLALMRFGVGAAESGFHSSALSLIADTFPSHRRSLALGIYYIGPALGSGTIFLVGSSIAAHFGWRAAFIFAGLPGLALGVLMYFTVREPRRGGRDAVHGNPDGRASLREVLRYIWTTHSIRYGIIGTTIACIMINSFLGWMVSFLVRAHGMPLARAGMIVAIAAGPAMGFASVAASPFADFFARGRPERIGFVPATALLLSVPIGWIALFASKPAIFMTATVFFGAMMGAWFAQAFGTVLTLSAPDRRGSVVGVLQFVANLAGGSGPLITGYISDKLGADGNALRWAIATMMSLSIPAAIFLIMASVRSGREAVQPSPAG
jgi:MFS family permease